MVTKKGVMNEFKYRTFLKKRNCSPEEIERIVSKIYGRKR